MLTIELLGGFRCLVNEQELAIASRKARGVVAYLALARGKSAQRAQLASIFWSSSGDQQARQSLRQCLSALRRALGDDARDVLVVDAETVALDSGHIDVDVDRLVAAAGSEDCALVMRAADAARGPLLADLIFGEESADDWLHDARVRVQSLSRTTIASSPRWQRCWPSAATRRRRSPSRRWRSAPTPFTRASTPSISVAR